MIKKKILIFGTSGLTGYKISKLASQNYDVICTFNSRPVSIENCNSLQVDISKPENISSVFEDTKPDLVINTTALHNVDFCEENPDKSFAVNCKAIQSLYENSQKHDSKLIHISTDYVFDGNSKTPYKESDNTTPVSIYGQSKLDGEKILENSNHVIVRPSVVYGWTPLELAGKTSSSGKPMNFALWVLTKLHANEPLTIVTDQFATATLADSLAESILKIASSDKSGLYHVSGLSCESRYDFTVKLAKTFGYDPSLISKTDSSQFKQKAKRPAYSCLDCTKAIQDFDLNLHTTESALEIMRSQVEKEAPHLLGNFRF